MRGSTSSSGTSDQPSRDRRVPGAFRFLDWTKFDSPPSSTDVKRMATIGGRDGPARIAVYVNTPRMLQAANVFAEQAGMHGAQVRVFVDADEALAWLYKDAPSDITDNQDAALIHPLIRGTIA